MCVVIGLVALGCSNSDDDAFPPVSTVDAGVSSSTDSTTTTTETSVTTSATTPDASTDAATATGPDGPVPDPSDGEAFDEYIAGRVEAFYAVRDRAFAEPSATPRSTTPSWPNSPPNRSWA